MKSCFRLDYMLGKWKYIPARYFVDEALRNFSHYFVKCVSVGGIFHLLRMLHDI